MVLTDFSGGRNVILETPQGDELHRIDRNKLNPLADEILLFSCVRDEVARLPYFLEYHRGLGVSRFLFIDNASTDGTTPLLLDRSDTHVFYTEASYAGSHYGVQWLNTLLGHYGAGHWVLVLDADELLLYPWCEDRPLLDLVREIESCEATALLTFLLDMYPKGPIREARYTTGTHFLETCSYFDTDSYSLGSGGLRSRIPERGGVRQRLFWEAGRRHRGNPPLLSKVPLVKWREGLKYLASTHLINGVRLASSTGVLMHFKLFADFVQRAIQEAKRGEHWDNAVQYSAYAQVLSESPNLTPIYPGSMRFRDSKQLMELGLMIDDC